MYASPRMATAVVIFLALTALALPTQAPAGPPATVTVRVEGLGETRLPATAVTTTTEPVVKDGITKDSCPGTNAIGALQLATAGNWSGKWFGGELNPQGRFEGLGYSVETILGESYPFTSGSFWDFWIDNNEAVGICGQEVQAGDQILLFPCHFEEGKECSPLGIEAPASANVGEPVQIAVKKYNSKGEASAVAGASLAGASAAASTDPSGHATVSFASVGHFTLRASAPELVRAEATICVHAGNDGGCSTPSPGAPGASSGSGASSNLGGTPYTGPYAVVAKATGPVEGRVYSRRHAPRVLTGTVIAHTAVTSVSVALRRRQGARCFAYSGVRALFTRARCGTAPFFRVSRAPSFSYLLPAALAPGRYVLDIEATDAAGNHTSLARGTSRIVFYVR